MSLARGLHLGALHRGGGGASSSTSSPLPATPRRHTRPSFSSRPDGLGGAACPRCLSALSAASACASPAPPQTHRPDLLGGASAPSTPLLSAESPSPPPPPPDPGANEYFLQVGVAIRTLRDEFPQLFEAEPSCDIFREDIHFTDRVGLPGAPAQAVGKEAYKGVFWRLRAHRSLFFSKVHVSILRIWQPRDRTLAVRWSIQASPRLLGSLGAGDVHYDGISWYKLDGKGLIYEHLVDNVDWGDPPLARNSSSLQALLQGLQPQPRPSFFAEGLRGLTLALTTLLGGRRGRTAGGGHQ